MTTKTPGPAPIPMTLRHIGARVSVRLTDDTTRTGTITAVDYTERTVTLRVGRRPVTIPAADIDRATTLRATAAHVRSTSRNH